MKKRLFSLFLAIALLCTMLPQLPMKVEAVTGVYTWIKDRSKVDGGDYTKSSTLANRLNQIFDGKANIYSNNGCTNLVNTQIGTSNVKNDGVIKYVGPYGGVAINSGTSCWIYANGVYYTLFGECTGNGTAGANSQKLNLSGTSNKKATYNNFKTWGVRQAVGALIRTDTHSMIVLNYDQDYLTILDGNGDGNGLVSIRVRSWDQVNFSVAYIIQPNETYFYTTYPECNHNYNNVGICSKCGSEYNWKSTFTSDDAGYYKVTKSGGIYLRTEKPYDASTAKSELIKEGTQVQVLGSVTNHYQTNGVYNKWYKVSYNGQIGYCFHEHLKQVAHTCDDKGGFQFYEAAHPHKNCYKCSICGKTWAKDGTSNVVSNCTTCQKPGKPVLTISKSAVKEGETIKFTWGATSNTTHYNLYIERKNSSGKWERYDQPFYVESGKTMKFEANEYRCLVQSVNSNCWTEDNSTWLYTEGDFVYFTVTKATHSHSYTSKVTTAATCTQNGVRTYTCSCGASYTESIAAKGHSYGSWVTTTAAGCTTTGTQKKTCSSCGNVQTQSIAAKGHSYGSWVTTTAAGCTTNGTQKKTCSSCGNVQTQTLAATGHNYQSTTIGATCNDYEKIRYICSKCQHSYEEYTAEAYSQWSTTKPTGVDASLIETKTQYSYRTISHTTEYSSWSAWSDWSTTRQSTSDLKKEESRTVWGYYYFKCPGCGAHMHGWGITCPSWAGGCGKTYIPEGAYVQVYSPTSWDNAGLKDWHGTGKYYTYINGELVFKWTEGGTNTQYRYATRTSKQVTNYGNWSSWSDTVYTASSTREVKTQTLYRYVQRQLGDHTWDSGKITTQATCTTNGTKTYTCTSCGTTKKETLKATGHNLKEYTEQATCTQEGKYGYVCTKCDYAENAGTIPATGHSYGDWVTTTPAGCTTPGTQEKTCASCGDVQTQSIAATGHNYSDWATTTAAGCTTTGTQEKTCASCGDVQTQFIAATGHSYGNWITTTAAGCTTTGIQEKSCASCGDKQTQSIAATGHNYVSGYCTSCGGKDPNTATASGTCGDNVRWTLDADGVLTISGTGAMYDWGYLGGASVGTCPWKNVKSSIKSVIIEHGVTTIGNCAFEDCFSLTSVTVPDSVISIGSCAFSYCENLTSVTIPGSVATIGVSAFDGCLNLTGVYISDIAAWCNILFGDDVSNPLFYAQKLYLNNELVTELIIPEGVVQINKLAFNNCVSLESVTIPETLETIGSSAFNGCLNLTGVYITNITAWCNINFVVYTANPLTYAKNLYLNNVLVTDLIIPDGVTTILKNAFSGSNVQSITLPEKITAIGARAFYGCTVLKNVYFGGSENQWKNINVSADNNCLLNATIHYGGTDAIVGDLTNDEQITNDDVVLLLWHSLFPEEYPLEINTDLNGDGNTDNEDVVLLLWHCLFPEENPL